MHQASGTDRPVDEGAIEVDRLAERVQRIGEEIGLPCIAASADIGSPEPMRNSRGEPFVETLFRWVDPDLRYWEDRRFALRSFFIHAVRVCSEPFFYAHGKLATWRFNPALYAVNQIGPVARVPMAALEGFESRLKAICAGESEFVLEAGGHEPAPQDVQSELTRVHASGGNGNGAH